MLKLFFYVLLAANGLLFAVHQGYLDPLLPTGREPARMGRQINADKLILSGAQSASPAGATGAPAAATEAPAAAAARPGKDQENQACTEIGNFGLADAARFEARVARLPFKEKLARREVPEAITHMVLIPPQGGKEGADQRVADLRALGIADYFVIQDNSRRRWGISLGLFKTAEAANAHLAAVAQRGVTGARVIEYNVGLARTAFQLRDPDPQIKAGIEKIMADFPRQEMRSCDS